MTPPWAVSPPSLRKSPGLFDDELGGETACGADSPPSYDDEMFYIRGGISFWFLVRLCPFLRRGRVLVSVLIRGRRGGLRIARGTRRREGLLVWNVLSR